MLADLIEREHLARRAPVPVGWWIGSREDAEMVLWPHAHLSIEDVFFHLDTLSGEMRAKYHLAVRLSNGSLVIVRWKPNA